MLVNNLTLIYRFIIRCQAFTLYVIFLFFLYTVANKRATGVENDRENEKAGKGRHIHFGK